MKAKVIVLIAVSAIVTLSFTFASSAKPEVKHETSKSTVDAPAGGFATEDKF